MLFVEAEERVSVDMMRTAYHIKEETAAMLKDEVIQLERLMCRWVPVEHCVAVSGVYQGLVLAMKALDIDSGDSVLCSGFAPGYVARAILEAGGEPMLVDINPNTYNVDPFCLEYVLGRCQRTGKPTPKILIATDTFGLPCNYEKLTEICQRHGITLIEDLSQALGADIGGVKTGQYGRFAVLSFGADPEQEMGGAVLCHSSDDAEAVHLLMRNHDLRVESDTQQYIQASFAAEWMKEMESHLQSRRALAECYRRNLQGACKTQQVDAGYNSAYTQFVIALPNPQHRAEIIEAMADQEVDCAYFDPVREGDPAEQAWDKVLLANTQNAYKKLITLPIYPYLSAHVTEGICDLLTQVLERH